MNRTRSDDRFMDDQVCCSVVSCYVFNLCEDSRERLRRVGDL